MLDFRDARAPLSKLCMRECVKYFVVFMGGSIISRSFMYPRNIEGNNVSATLFPRLREAYIGGIDWLTIGRNSSRFKDISQAIFLTFKREFFVRAIFLHEQNG